MRSIGTRVAPLQHLKSTADFVAFTDVYSQ